eukprot:5369072-Pleurochrysis_carterae.AAC.3
MVSNSTPLVISIIVGLFPARATAVRLESGAVSEKPAAAPIAIARRPRVRAIVRERCVVAYARVADAMSPARSLATARSGDRIREERCFVNRDTQQGGERASERASERSAPPVSGGRTS